MKNLHNLPIKSAVSTILFICFAAFLNIAQADETLKSGSFKGANGHVTKGSVNVIKAANGSITVELAANFSFDGAPDPKVGLGKDGQYDISTQAGHLNKYTGKQTYTLPASVNIDEYNEVYIWCEQYSVSLGKADIK